MTFRHTYYQMTAAKSTGLQPNLHRERELAERPIHRHLLTHDRGRNAIRELDGFLADSRRASSPCVRSTFPSRRAPRLQSRPNRRHATPTVAMPKRPWDWSSHSPNATATGALYQLSLPSSSRNAVLSTAYSAWHRLYQLQTLLVLVLHAD